MRSRDVSVQIPYMMQQAPKTIIFRLRLHEIVAIDTVCSVGMNISSLMDLFVN